MKNLKQQKQIICEITNRLFEVENIDADTIPNILFQFMNAVGCINDTDDLDLIDKFVDSCNRKDLSILLIERLFDKAFFEQKEPIFEEVFNEGKEVKPIDIFKTLNGYFNFK
jgi:hypothetical protein